jgi:hypothetical protein
MENGKQVRIAHLVKQKDWSGEILHTISADMFSTP